VWYTLPVRLETTPAIVLRTREYGESDKIVTLLSRGAGKFSGIAKGAKRSQRRFPGTLEIFSHVMLDYRRRPHADLAFLDRAVLLEPWPRILSSLERFAAASHAVELADKLTVESEVGDDLYVLVAATLARLNAAEPGPATLRLFELAALNASGYRPELIVCRGCRCLLAAERGPVRLIGSLGGLLCPRCRTREEGGMLLSSSALECLGLLQAALRPRVAAGGAHGAGGNGHGNGAGEGPFVAEAALEERLGPRVARELAAALDLLLTPHLRARLRSLELLAPALGERLSGPDELP
jgi:DNA repair protein RecO (recombination protein O)